MCPNALLGISTWKSHRHMITVSTVDASSSSKLSSSAEPPTRLLNQMPDVILKSFCSLYIQMPPNLVHVSIPAAAPPSRHGSLFPGRWCQSHSLPAQPNPILYTGAEMILLTVHLSMSFVPCSKLSYSSRVPSGKGTRLTKASGSDPC